MDDIPWKTILITLSFVTLEDKVNGLSSWEVTPIDTVVRKGNSTTLFCKVNLDKSNEPPDWFYEKPDGKHIQITDLGVSYKECCTVIGEVKAGEVNLHIDSATLEDEGVYRCQHSNLPIQRGHIFVIDAGVSCTKSSSNIGSKSEIIVGTTVTLKCALPRNDFSQGRLVWTKNGVIENNSPVFEKEIGKEDDGISYNCIFEHPSITIPWTCPTDIKPMVQYPPVATIPNSLCIQKGNKLNISCTYTQGQPGHTQVQWTKVGGSFVRDGNPLIVPNIQPESNGQTEYTCNVNNTYWDGTYGVDTVKITLDVQYAPMVTIEGSTTVKEGEALELVCNIDANPEHDKLRWIHHNDSVQIGDRLTLNNIYRSQGGRYTCEASNTFCSGIGTRGSGRLDVEIDVYFIPSADDVALTRVGDTAVNSGDNLSFLCIVESSNPAATIYWYMNGERLNKAMEWIRLLEIDDTSIGPYNGKVSKQRLELTTSASHNGARVMCTALNAKVDPQREITSNNLSCEIYFPPKYPEGCSTKLRINDGVEPRTYTANSVLMLSCTSCSSNPAAEIRWHGKISSSPKTEYISYFFGGLRTLQNQSIYLTPQHHGAEYSCEAINNRFPEEGSISNTVTLDVHYIPFTVNESRNNVTTANSGGMAKFTCQVRSNPYPTVTWYDPKGGVLMTSEEETNGVLQTNTLILYNVSAGDYGKYTCKAKNHLGSATVYITLQGKSRPTPASITNISVADNAGIVMWKPGFDGGEPQTFYVEYKEVLTGVTYRTENTTDVNTTLTNLKPGTAYQITVISANRLGDHRSNTITTTTSDSPSTISRKSDSTIAIAIVTGVILVIAMVPLLLIFMLRRKNNNNKRRRDNVSTHSHFPLFLTRQEEAVPLREIHPETQENTDVPTYAVVNKRSNRRQNGDYITLPDPEGQVTIYENVPRDAAATAEPPFLSPRIDEESKYINIPRTQEETPPIIEPRNPANNTNRRNLLVEPTYTNTPRTRAQIPTYEGPYELLQEPIPLRSPNLKEGSTKPPKKSGRNKRKQYENVRENRLLSDRDRELEYELDADMLPPEDEYENLPDNLNDNSEYTNIGRRKHTNGADSSVSDTGKDGMPLPLPKKKRAANVEGLVYADLDLIKKEMSSERNDPRRTEAEEPPTEYATIDIAKTEKLRREREKNKKSSAK
ncbi:nephrin-like isoform X2 [Glandiceps talaboti]